MLVTIVGVGVIAGGWVVTSEVTTQTQMSQFQDALEASAKFENQGDVLLTEIGSRQTWTAQEATDMRTVASLYGQAADALAESRAPAEYLWYRDGLVHNYREAVDITTQYSYLTSSSYQSAFDTLNARWVARVRDIDQLEARLKAQERSSP